MSSYYRILGVSRFADPDEIRQAYWSLTRRLRHRHSGSDDARLARIHEAYWILGDTTRRRRYDQTEGARAYRGSDSPGRVLASTEVPVAFPSMMSVVPRMLASFFGASGEAPATHVAQVELTPKEAHEGTRVPLEVSFKPTCPVCGGRGESWAESCAVCNGTGSGQFSQQLHVRVPPGVRHGTCLTFSVTPPFAGETEVELRIAVQ